MQISSLSGREMTKEIVFLAISRARRFLHWLPAALRLAEEPKVRVTLLVSSAAGHDFIRAYDSDRRRQIKRLWAPSVCALGQFTPPHRLSALLLSARAFGRDPRQSR